MVLEITLKKKYLSNVIFLTGQIALELNLIFLYTSQTGRIFRLFCNNSATKYNSEFRIPNSEFNKPVKNLNKGK
jgi:hypothetical protein